MDIRDGCPSLYGSLVGWDRKAKMGETRCNCLALRKAARKTTQLYDAALSEAGIRATQYHILAHLGRHPDGDTIGEIANELALDRATLGHSLKPLEREGLISFSVGDDRRSRVIALTRIGIVKLEEAKSLWLRVQRKFENEFGAGYSEQLRRDLEKVASDCPLPT